VAGTKSFTVFTKFAVKNGASGAILSIAKGADKMAQRVEVAKNTLGKMGKFAAGLGKGLAVVGGVAAGAGAAVFALAKNSATAADDILNTANAIGLTTDALQQYRYVGIQAGLTTEEMDGALNKLTVNLGKNFEEVDAALYQIGLSAEGLKAAGPDKALEYIAQGFKATQDPAKKAAVATAIFGKSSIRMVNALEKGSAGIADLRKEAGEIGYVMDGSALEAAGNLDDSLDKLGSTATGAGNRLAQKLIPGVSKLVAGLQKGLQPGGKLSGIIDGIADFGGSIGQGLGPTFDKIMEFVPKIIGFIKDIWSAIQPVLQPILGMIEPIFKIFENLMPLIKGVVSAISVILAPIADLIKWILEGIAMITNTVPATGNTPGFRGATDPTGSARTAPRFSTPMSANTVPLSTSSSTSTTTTSKVELSVAPGVNAKQDKPAPGVTLATGQTQSFATPRGKR